MHLQIGAVIASQRKTAKVTQQALADFIGVSKASVSKWENGQSYPDVTLLPLLAAYFDISVDQLLTYNAQLTTTEIQRIYQQLKAEFGQQDGAVLLKKIHDLVRQYYSCYPFVLQMGLLLVNHLDYLPGKDAAEKQTTYLTEAHALFERVKNAANDPELVVQARSYQAYCDLMLQQPEQVLAALGEFVPATIPPESLIAGAFQQLGRNDEALRTVQSALFQYLTELMSLLTNSLLLLNDQPTKFAETYQRTWQLATAFSFPEIYPVVVLNFLLGACLGFAHQRQIALLGQALTQFETVLRQVVVPIKLQGDAYFDRIQPWLDQLEIGPQTPRNSNHLRRDLLRVLLGDPQTQALAKEPTLAPQLQKLQTLLEVEQHDKPAE